MKKYLLALNTCVALSLLASCTPKDDDATNEDGTVTISIFTYSGNEYEGVKSDSTMKKIEEETGVKMDIRGASSADYYTVLSPLMGSLSLPDVIWSDPKNSNGAFTNWANPAQDLLWNLDELIIGNESRYPYLSKLIYSDKFKNVCYYDGHYLIPEVQTNTAWAIYYRADWLKEIGFTNEDGTAKAPTTLDEFEYVMKAFTGNNLFNGGTSGQTYGFAPNTENFYVNPLYGAFGITPDWDIDDSGKVTYMYAKDEFKPYLNWMQQMYDKGYIDPTYFQATTENQTREKWWSGKVGCIMTNGEAHMEWVIGKMNNHNEDVIVGPALIGTGNTSTITGCTLGVKDASGFSNWGGYYGGYAITKDCKDSKKALDLFEYLVSPEGSKLRLYGIEGTHYTVGSNNEIIPSLENRENEAFQKFGQVTASDGSQVYGGLHKVGALFGYEIDWDEYEKTGNIEVKTDIASLYPNYQELEAKAISYTSSLQTSNLLNCTSYPQVTLNKMTEVQKISASYINKVISGQKNLSSDWDKMISECNNAGYENIKAVVKEVAISLGIIKE